MAEACRTVRDLPAETGLLPLCLRSIFLYRYLDSLELRQEIHEGLNVMENWNSANGFIYFGRGARWPPTALTTKRSACSHSICCNSRSSMSTPSRSSRCSPNPPDRTGSTSTISGASHRCFMPTSTLMAAFASTFTPGCPSIHPALTLDRSKPSFTWATIIGQVRTDWPLVTAMLGLGLKLGTGANCISVSPRSLSLNLVGHLVLNGGLDGSRSSFQIRDLTATFVLDGADTSEHT